MAGPDRERWAVLDPLLDRALDLTAGARAGLLVELRGSSPTMADELGVLLAADDDADRQGFLAQPLATAIVPAVVEPEAGLQLGGYVIERTLGRGGMGSVWLARRADGRFEGRVAVKFLHHGLLGDAGRERFRREGSMLARLAHPGIARLLDAGVTAGGQPYLVLEYVEGQWVDAYANAQGLGTAERIRLVLQVLAAVDHAHARLIIHRDLKPSNILVTADGTAKLLDFGIAKLLGDDGGDAATALTADGFRALTPEFAAPEQMRCEPVTTATDVYAVGVLLYALLTGKRPFDLAGRSAATIERMICETVPPRPSTVLDGALSGVERSGRELRGDLDAIVMKALHKEPARRYPSVAALAEDLQRHLDGRPVRARPDSAGYRMRKFVGRHRGSVVVAGAVLALGIGAGLRERALRGRAEGEARKARAVEEYLVSVFDVADPFGRTDRASGPDVTARALLDRGAARVDSALAGQPDVQAELRGALGRVYGKLGMYDSAATLLRRSLDQRRAVYGQRAPEVAEAMDRLGEVLVAQNEFEKAEPLLREALAQRRALFGDRDTTTAASLDHVATLLQETGRLADAEPLFREAVAIQRAVRGPIHSELANEINNLALLLYLRGAYDDAEPLYRQALAIDVRTLGEDHPETAATLQNLAQLQHYRGRFDEAEVLYRRSLAAKRKSLGDLHPSVTISLNNLGVMLAQELGRVDEAEPLVREALALDRRMFGPRHSYVAESVRNLAMVLRLKGDLAGAERLYRETLDMNRALFGPEHSRVATALANIASTRHLEGDVAGAIPLYRQALGQFERLVGAKHRNTIGVTINLARALRETGDPAAAERLLRGAVSRLDTTSRTQRAQVVAAYVALGEALTDQGRAAEARPLLARAVALGRERFVAGDWRMAEAALALGRCLVALGDTARAGPLLREADASLARTRGAQPRLASRARSALQELAGARLLASARTGR